MEHKFENFQGFVHAHGLSTFKLTRAMGSKDITPASILRELVADNAGTIQDNMKPKGLELLIALDAWSSQTCQSSL